MEKFLKKLLALLPSDPAELIFLFIMELLILAMILS